MNANKVKWFGCFGVAIAGGWVLTAVSTAQAFPSEATNVSLALRPLDGELRATPAASVRGESVTIYRNDVSLPASFLMPIRGMPGWLDYNGVADDARNFAGTERVLTHYTFMVCDNLAEGTYTVSSALYPDDGNLNGCPIGSAPLETPIAGTECQFSDIPVSGNTESYQCLEFTCSAGAGGIAIPEVVHLGLTSSRTGVDLDGNLEKGIESATWWPVANQAEIGFTDDALSMPAGLASAPPWEGCYWLYSPEPPVHSGFYFSLFAVNESPACACQLYGESQSTANCNVDVDELTYVVFGYANPEAYGEADFEPCGGDGDVDVDDIVAVVFSFAGIYWCPHPCPP
jgi:hypothetical protein